MTRYTTSRAASWAARSRLTRPFFDEGRSLREGQHGKQDVDLRLEEIQQFVAPKRWALMALYSSCRVWGARRTDGLPAAHGGCSPSSIRAGDPPTLRPARELRQATRRNARSSPPLLGGLRLDQGGHRHLHAGGRADFPRHGRHRPVLARLDRGPHRVGGLSAPESSDKGVGRPRTRVTRDQVLALRSQGLSYRAVACRLHISPALAHRLAQDTATTGPSGRSETSPASLETAPNPQASPAAFQGHHPPATGKRSNL